MSAERRHASPQRRSLPAFAAPYAAPDEEIAARLLAAGAARRRRRSAHRCARDAAGRGDPRRIRRARRHRGFPARVFALDPGGPRPDGAGRGAAARAGCRDRRPADRGQARGRRLDPPRGEIRRAAGLGLGLGARHLGAHHPAGRDAGEHPRKPRQAARPAGGARRDAPGDAAARLAFRARPDHRGGARRAPRITANSATPSTCWARARAPPPTRSAISQPMRDAIEAIGADRRQCARCPTGRASRSSSRRCIRATRRSRASAC